MACRGIARQSPCLECDVKVQDRCLVVARALFVPVGHIQRRRTNPSLAAYHLPTYI